jgi:hypothetical protein
MLTTINLSVETFAFGEEMIVAEVLDLGSCAFQIPAGITDAGYSCARSRSPPASPMPAAADTQLGVRWRNSFSASAAAKIGQAEIATMMAKSSASMTNSQVFSLAK